MKHLKLFFALFAMLALGVGNAWGAESKQVTLDFTSNSWGFPSGSSNKTTAEKTYTSGNYSIILAGGGSSNGHYYNTNGYLMLGKNGATLTLPAFDFNTTKIVVTGKSGASSSVQQNIYVGSTAVSTTTSGATGTNTYVINEAYQAAGNVYVLKVTSNANTQITKIEVYGESNSTEPPTPAKTYDVTWMVNGEEWAISEDVEENTQITTLPTEPTDECAGKVFQGWTDKEITDGQKPAVLFKDKSPEITDDLTFYAVFATVPAGGGTGGSITISSETTNFPTGYGTANTFTEYTLENYKFKIQQVYKTGGKLQWRASGNKNGTGTMYNTQKFPANIASIVVVFDASDNNKNHTVKVGATENPTSGTSISPSISGATYTFDCSGGSYDYFVLTNGTNAGYISSITINYGSVATPSDYTTSCSGSTEPVVSLTTNPTSLDFGSVAHESSNEKSLTVSGQNLTEDVTLTISGTNANFFSVSPATITKADDVEETVTVTYNPTATGDHTATLTIKTGDITQTVDLSGTVLAPGKWALVKNVAELSAGDEIIIASAASNYAIGIAASNNYKGAAITKVGETANTTTDVTILTVEETGVAEAPYAFKTNDKYLYAASSSANQLKAQATNNANGQWAVTITAEGVASIVAAKSSNRNVMQCNPNGGSPIFACYESASASYEALAIYRNSENVAKPIISGEANFVGSTQVTITAKSGLTVYYTTDDSTPDKTATQYNAPFTISATTIVKAIAYDATDNASPVAEMTFTKQELVNVATAMALEKDEVAYFDEFEVVKVVTGKGNIYIKDASGHGLIYDNTLAGELKDGDRVQGFVGISSPYNGLPEAKPVDGLTVADLTIISGVAAEPYDFTSTAIAATDINKYVVFNDVEIATAVSMSNSNKEFSLTINGSNVAFYNQFSIEKTLEAGKTYDIYGFVSIYNEKLQVYFYQALEEDEVVTKYTVTYNAGGATGEVPVDDNEYTEGAQVYLKSATGLTKEGYDYKGWKVTDEGGHEIAVSSNKFNMPASNVTVTAQWEEIVVAPRQDFSEGIWVRVTNADELATDDYVVVAAANLDVAMKSYESGNYCTHMTITKYGSTFLQWDENVGVFQLAKNNDNYTIQDVNTKQYLYAAGSGSNNYLKAANEIPTDADEVKKYIWTITIEDGVTTVKATSENRNTLKYNKNSGQERFSCYASGQENVVLYKYQTSYTRNVTNTWGTICLPYASSNYTGMELYEVSWLKEGTGLYLDQLAAGDQLEAGKPYIFRATSIEIKVTCTGDAVATPIAGENGLTGTFADIAANTDLVGHYIIAQNKIWQANDQNTLPANRAYIANTVPTSEQPKLAGRRRVCMGENAATGLDNITNGENTTIKVIENGQLVIIRNGEKFNAQGQKL